MGYLYPSHARLLLPLQKAVGQIIRFRVEAWSRERYRIRGLTTDASRLQVVMDELDRPVTGRVTMDALLFASLRPVVIQPELGMPRPDRRSIARMEAGRV